MTQMINLNLGCSDDHKIGYINVDIGPPADQIVDLSTPWPWETSSVNYIYAKDVLEHIEGPGLSGQKGKIWGMNEAHRVLKPGGTIEFLVPLVSLSDGHINPGAFADPTHVSFWTVDDRYYFCDEWNNQQGERGRLGPAYGITALFKIVKWSATDYGMPHERRSKLHAILTAVK